MEGQEDYINIKKEIKKVALIKEEECTCPMCTKSSMEQGQSYSCKKMPGAFFGVCSLDFFNPSSNEPRL